MRRQWKGEREGEGENGAVGDGGKAVREEVNKEELVRQEGVEVG